MPDQDADNREQIEYWNGPAGERWVAQQTSLDPRLEDFARTVIERSALGVGHRVLDVGCGCGATTLLLAERVGEAGEVVGLDISGPMLARGRERAAGLTQVRFIHGDASIYPFEPRFDRVFSRFGVMFFARPATSFANLRRALREGGQLAFVSWRSPAENPWIGKPLAAAMSVVDAGTASPLPADPESPGPYSLSDPARIQRILAEGGFCNVSIEAYDRPITMGATVDEATSFAVQNGPVARLMDDLDEPTRLRARNAVREVIAKEAEARSDGSVVMASATWVVTASLDPAR